VRRYTIDAVRRVDDNGKPSNVAMAKISARRAARRRGERIDNAAVAKLLLDHGAKINGTGG
jgi:hypothetical protein